MLTLFHLTLRPSYNIEEWLPPLSRVAVYNRMVKSCYKYGVGDYESVSSRGNATFACGKLKISASLVSSESIMIYTHGVQGKSVGPLLRKELTRIIKYWGVAKW